MRVDIITIFPELFDLPLKTSILGRAVKRGLIEIGVINLRDFTHDAYRTVDDRPFGGGAGMVMKPEPLFEAVESIRTSESLVILTSPRGQTLRQPLVHELSSQKHLIIICGHYEGVDERVVEGLVDMEISIGDYILTSGNLPAMVMIDAVVRLLPGALGCTESAVTESFENEGLLDFPQYTRPEVFRDMRVPPILLSGDHAKIAEWRCQKQLQITSERRPDLIRVAKINNPELNFDMENEK